MSSSGYIQTKHNLAGKKFSFRLQRLTTSQSLEDNTSTIEWQLFLIFDSASDVVNFGSASKGYSVNIDGTVYSGTCSFNTSSTVKVLATGKKVVPHYLNGSKNFFYSFNLETNISYGGEILNGYVNQFGNAPLDNLDRTKLTVAPNFTDEDNPTVEYTNPFGNNASAVNLAIATKGTQFELGDIIVQFREVSAVGSTYTFDFTEAEREALRALVTNSTTAEVCYITETVYNGKSYYNDISRTLTLVNAEPVITAAVKDVNSNTVALTGNPNKLVKYYSRAEATFTAEGRKGAVIDLDTALIKNGNRTGYNSPTTFTNIEINTFTFSIGDNRGLTSNKSITVDMVDYIKLTCNVENAVLETNGELTVNISGNYFNNNFGVVNNSLAIECRYKEANGSYSGWRNVEVSLNGNTYTAMDIIAGLDYRKTYIVQIRATDKLSSIMLDEIKINSFPIFHWSDTDFVFEVPVTFNAGVSGADLGGGGEEDEPSSGNQNNGIIEGDASISGNATINGNTTIGGDTLINGNLRLKGSGNYGNILYFGDGAYTTISEPSDDNLEIKASVVNLKGTVRLNGLPLESGTWNPTFNVPAAVSNYNVRQGWYNRVGNVVTIGWQLKATINSGYESTALSITGAPYKPAYAAFGGGVAHNITIGTNLFEGWAIGVDGAISARLQPSTKLTSGNLNISSTSYYPTGTNEIITVAGTICYVVS